MARNILPRTWRFLARTDVAAILMVVIVLLAAIGSLFPQVGPTLASDPERMSGWDAALRARYGVWTGFLRALGAFWLFGSPLFLAPLALLTLATLVCTLQRWTAAWRGAFRQPVRLPDVVLEAVPQSATLTASPQADLTAILRRSLEDRDYRVRSETAAGIIHLRGDRNRLFRLATLLEHLAVLFLLVAALLSSLGWREELTVGPGDAAEVGHGSGLVLGDVSFTISRYPDGSPADYVAELTVADDRQQARYLISVNRPLALRGVNLYLSGYEQTEAGYRVTLLAVRDPGYGPIVGAGILFLLAMAASFYFPHSAVHARVSPGGMVRLAGWAERWAFGFEREFAGLVEEVRGACGSPVAE